MTNTFGCHNAFPASEDQTAGLTKRELFASMAMQGMMSNPEMIEDTNEQIAKGAVEVANALIEQLNK